MAKNFGLRTALRKAPCLIADLYPETRVIRSSNPVELTDTGSGVYFVADDMEHGAELWWAANDAGKARLVRDIAPGEGHSDPQSLVLGGGQLFFAADDGQHGMELWRGSADGSSAEIAADLCPGSEGSQPAHLLAGEDALLFCASGNSGGDFLYQWNYADEALHPVAAVEKLLPGGRLEGISRVNGQVYAVFRDDEERYRFALWNPVSMTLDLPPYAFPAFPQWPDIQRCALDHHAEGSVSWDRLLECYFALPSMTGQHCRVGSNAWFSAYTPSDGMELWIYSYGTTRASLAQECFPGPASSSPRHLLQTGGGLYFSAESPEGGRRLWYTPSGLGQARLVPERPAAPHKGVEIREIVPFRGGIRLVTSSRDGGPDYVLARCGENGHAPILERFSYPSESPVKNPKDLTPSGGYLYFTAENGGVGRELWRTKGGAWAELAANILIEPAYRSNFAVGPSLFQPGP